MIQYPLFIRTCITGVRSAPVRVIALS